MKYLCTDCATDLRDHEEAMDHAKTHGHYVSGQVEAARAIPTASEVMNFHKTLSEIAKETPVPTENPFRNI